MLVGGRGREGMDDSDGGRCMSITSKQVLFSAIMLQFKRLQQQARIKIMADNYQHNSTNCRRKLKQKLTHIHHNQAKIQNAIISHKAFRRNKCITYIDTSQSLASLKIKTPTFLPSPKIFSEAFFGKFCRMDKSSNDQPDKRIAKEKEATSSPRSLKECLQEKILQNVKRHKRRQRLPLIKRPQIRMQDAQIEGRQNHDQNFVVWQKMQKQQLMRFGVNQPLMNLKTGRTEESPRHKSKQMQFVSKKKEKYSFFRDFTPWGQPKSKEILIQEQL